MKYLSIITVWASLFIAFTANAQNRPSAEERAGFFMERISQKVDLTDSQEEQVKALATQFMIKHDSIRELYRGNHLEMRSAMDLLREEQSIQIKEILSEEQQEQFFANIPKGPRYGHFQNKPSPEQREEMHAFMLSERATFESVLTESEKEIIAQARDAVSAIHEREQTAKREYGFYNIRIFKDENPELFQQVKDVVESHRDELKAIKDKAFDSFRNETCRYAGDGVAPGQHKAYGQKNGMKSGKGQGAGGGKGYGKGKGQGQGQGSGQGYGQGQGKGGGQGYGQGQGKGKGYGNCNGKGSKKGHGYRHGRGHASMGVYFLLLDPNAVNSQSNSLRLKISPVPVAETAEVTYTLTSEGTVSLIITDANGNLVETLVNGTQEAGMQSATIDASNLNGGSVYVAVLTTANGHANCKFMVK